VGVLRFPVVERKKVRGDDHYRKRERRGFLCDCMSALVKGAIVEVTLSGGSERYVERAMVVRKESSGTPWHRYGFQFQKKTLDWIFQES
jgi:hypothetical protein